MPLVLIKVCLGVPVDEGRKLNENSAEVRRSIAPAEFAAAVCVPSKTSALPVGAPGTSSTVMPYVNSNAPSARVDLISTAKLQLDGYDRFTERSPPYFRLQQPMEHHTAAPANTFIYNYCFALRPEDAQPTGSLNASRIDSIVWQIQMNPILSSPLIPTWQQRGNCHVVIYARNYNVFRVINGFGGLLFTV